MVLFIYINMYNRKKAVEYAYTWWNSRNPQFFNFDNFGGDCTNFISQCLYYGDIPMQKSNNLGWFYNSSNNRSYSWTGVVEFFNFCTQNNTGLGPKAKLVTISMLEIGDIVQLQQFSQDRFHHNLIITKINGIPNIENIFVTCHTNDAKDKPLKDYYYNKIRFLKILN